MNEEKWQRKNLLIQAEEWLQNSQKGIYAETYISLVKYYLKEADAEFKDIGTSEEKINEILKEYYLSWAKKFLEYARQRKDYTTKTYIVWVKKYLRKANAEFKDIGTNKKELSEILKLKFLKEKI